ncbi:MAG TPA: hypothetical protein VEQ34_04965 [Pyrinomonadaceae bacterium]|nr:hypothetical protein [Pyrinomonadaceae bacterium]
MLRKFTFIWLVIVTVFALNQTSPAQEMEETEPATSSALANTALPAGALRVKETSVPQEIKDTLAKLVASGGDKIRQGDSEVLTIADKIYKKSTSIQLMKKIETDLQKAGWVYEIGEKNNEFVMFSLFRKEPQNRALLGFFVPTDEGLVIALTEMLAREDAIAENQNNNSAEPLASETKPSKPNANGSSPHELAGKWVWASTGSMYRNPVSGVTVAGRSSRFTYEFSPNGTVEYVGIMQTTSLANCRMEVFSTKKGKVSISGGKMTIAFAPATFTRDDSCDRAGNYKKTLPAETETYNWQIKNSNGRVLLCLEGKEGETCFDKSN